MDPPPLVTSPGRLGITALATGSGCFVLVALLGPSAMQPALPGPAWQPSYALHVGPSPYLVIGLTAAGIALAALGLALCLYAVRRGWRPPARPLFVAGLLVAAACAVLPPIGSGDHLNYAAYGRMVTTGHDPYVTRAVDLPGDPIADAAQEWRLTPSVYGPIATAQQTAASWLGGGSVRLTVFLLSVTNALAFALVAWILYRFAGSEERRLRGTLLWTFNPLMLFHLVAGAHNDVLSIATAIGALAVCTGRRDLPGSLAAGALAGASAAIKFPAALVAGGPAWVLLRRWYDDRRPEHLKRLAALAGGALGVAVVTYTLAGEHAFDQVRRASNSVSLATPWHLLDAAMGVNQHRIVIKTGSLVLLLGLIWLLGRALPGDDDRLRIAAVLVVAWLFTAPYALPWYDGLGWAVLALLPWSRFDMFLLAHTTALSLAYLPARDAKMIGLPDGLSWLAGTVRPTVIPWALTALLVSLVVTCLRTARPAPEPAGSPRASAGSPG